MLPSRDEFFLDLSLILEGTVYEAFPVAGEQMSLIPDNRPRQQELDFTNEFGHVNVDALCDSIERLSVVRNLVAKHHFHHWELVFADIFADRGGFDLNVGNPPWIKIEWNEGGLLGDYDPLFVIRNMSASQMAVIREETIAKRRIRDEYFGEYVSFEGTQSFLNAYQNYPILKGIQSNLYKCFLPHAWHIGSEQGVSGFLHPEGVYDDPNGGRLREAIYPRLKYHFQFENEFSLFVGTNDHGRMRFGLHIYQNSPNSDISFTHISNLFNPRTVDSCFNHAGEGLVGGIKNDENDWNTQGHLHRLILVDYSTLDLFSRLYDDMGTPATQAQLPVIHSRQVIEVLRKLAVHPRRLADLEGEYFSTEMWHETNAEKDGTIKRSTRFAEKPENWILSGPHFYVGNPFNKTPRRSCTANSHYDPLDLTGLSDDYLPRTNYILACDTKVYLKRTPKVTWDENNPVTEYYRLVFRGMIGPMAERTLIGAIIPPNAAHINGAQTTAFKGSTNLLKSAFIAMALVSDFYIKSTGRSNLHYIWENLPLIDISPVGIGRILQLNCLTTHYAELWEECWDESFRQERWTKDDPRLVNGKFANLTPKWQRNCALRTDYERRQAFVEIDVLAAMALGLTLDELCTIYRIQFPVLRQNENDTWYDQNGRIVFTCSKGLPGVGFSRPEWNDIKDMKSGAVSRTIMDDTLPGGPRERTITYAAPFDRCDRETDYTTAWAVFEQRGVR